MNKKINRTAIRRSAKRYLHWLTNSQWFNTDITNKDEWTEPLESIITKKSQNPEELWEAVIDHWQCTNWNEDSLPSAFQELYDMVDEFRTNRGVDSTNQA